jgi:FKBP12-rapamycin complex-associated protein
LLKPVLLPLLCSTDSKHKQESARLLGCLVHACSRLILPYIAPVLKVTAHRTPDTSELGAHSGVMPTACLITKYNQA